MGNRGLLCNPRGVLSRAGVDSGTGDKGGRMTDGKKTMTLNLTDAEMRVVESLATKKELTKTALIRQAIRLYQLIEARISQGDKLVFENKTAKKKAELMLP